LNKNLESNKLYLGNLNIFIVDNSFFNIFFKQQTNKKTSI